MPGDCAGGTLGVLEVGSPSKPACRHTSQIRSRQIFLERHNECECKEHDLLDFTDRK